jgi:hypothetical protein
VEPLGQLEFLTLRHLPAPLSHEIFQIGETQFPQLALMAPEGCHLEIEGGGDITPEVYVFRRPKEDLPHFVGLQTLGEHVGVRQMVSRIGEDRIERAPTRDSVVPVPHISAMLVRRHNGRGSMKP